MSCGDECCDEYELGGYEIGDTVEAVKDFDDTGNFGLIHKGTRDKISSISSDHHGGLQLNLVKYGRGWSNHIWQKVT